MSIDRFELLGIDRNPEGVWVRLRCTDCGAADGFLFPDEPLLGRFPILCSCGTEAWLVLDRPTLDPSPVQALADAFPWAPVLERRLIPKAN